MAGLADLSAASAAPWASAAKAITLNTVRRVDMVFLLEMG
jgi:hypothetical protein